MSEEHLNKQQVFAAVDLGSNSFHLTLATFQHQNIQIVGRLKTRVQLAAGLDEYSKLDKESFERGLACLKKFGERLQGMPASSVKATATYTLRKARNAKKFISKAEKVLGFPIEVISGREEARLIYSGVAHYDISKKKMLVVDIGGGSTEFATGQAFKSDLLDSLQMGSVSFSKKYFKNGKIKKSYFKKAITATRLELLTTEDKYLRDDWDEVIGTSGSIAAIELLIKLRNLSQDGITYSALEILKKEFIAAGNVESLELPEDITNRKEIISSALAILMGIFKSLKIKKMSTSQAALREGLLFELLGKNNNEDIREDSIVGLRDRFHMDIDQAKRVRKTAKKIYKMVRKDWNIEEKELRQLLLWASYTHEIGMSLNYSNQQKHGDYIIRNTDIAGFSLQKKNQLALLIRSSRRKFPFKLFAEIDDTKRSKRLIKIARILRMAILLNHRRRDNTVLPESIDIDDQQMTLNFNQDVLSDMSLLRADLDLEKEFLEAHGLILNYN